MGRKPYSVSKCPRLFQKRRSANEKMKKMRAAKFAVASTSTPAPNVSVDVAGVFFNTPSTSDTDTKMSVDGSDVLVNEELFFNSDISEKDNSVESNESSDFNEGNCSSSDSLLELEVEIEQKYESESSVISGRRFVDIAHLLKSLKSLQHEGFGCSFFNMDIISEKRLGFASVYTVKCSVCNKVDTVSTEKLEDESKMNVNLAAVSATVSIGAGYTQLSEFASAMDIPTISSATYANYHDQICDIYNRAATESMAKAAEEEAILARENGEVDSEGYPTIAVVADGAWCKRSYRSNYNALSGVACIVGLRTKKLLYMAVKNKYCLICARKDLYENETCPEHTCYKNWTGTSTSMEANIIVEGFKKSVAMYGIKYVKLIGDGDSSVHRKLLECMPYGSIIIQKIECKNHILRNYINKLKDCVKRPKTDTKLKNAISQNILRFRTAVTKAIEFRKSQNTSTAEKIKELQLDILNGPKHIFGDHTGCVERKYFCPGPKNNEDNIVPDLIKSGLFEDIMVAVRRVACQSNSLIYDFTNNSAELYNSQVAKFVGGKRINFALRRSYNARCEAAVVAHNNVGALHEIIHSAAEKTPGKYTSAFCQKKKQQAASRREKVNRTFRSRKVAGPDADYGPSAAETIPDMSDESIEETKQTFLHDLSVNKEEILLDTVGQSKNHQWHQERRKRLTASNFGRICKMRQSTSCANTVKNMLYQQFSGSVATRYGSDNEHQAIEQFKEITKLNVSECGLFVYDLYPYLAASPDGLINDDAIIEVKCPYSARMFSPEEATVKKCIKFCEIHEGRLKLKQKDNYMYQIQGQLNITKREKCYFVIWTPHGISVEIIKIDVSFWNEEMLPKLKNFYLSALLPEIIDPRYPRQLPIREVFLK